jgi:hypothetical protein
MLRRLKPRLTYANVISTVCLFVILGGSSYAVTRIGSRQIVNNSVRTQDIRNNTIRTRDVRNGSLLTRDFRRGQIPGGAPGEQGRPGNPGAQGSAVAFARIDANGQTFGDGSSSKNFTNQNVQHPAAGVYCIGGLNFTPANSVAVIDTAEDLIPDETIGAVVRRGNVPLGQCGPNHQQARITIQKAGALLDHRFMVWFEKGVAPTP